MTVFSWWYLIYEAYCRHCIFGVRVCWDTACTSNSGCTSTEFCHMEDQECKNCQTSLCMDESGASQAACIERCGDQDGCSAGSCGDSCENTPVTCEALATASNGCARSCPQCAIDMYNDLLGCTFYSKLCLFCARKHNRKLCLVRCGNTMRWLFLTPWYFSTGDFFAQTQILQHLRKTSIQEMNLLKTSLQYRGKFSVPVHGIIFVQVQSSVLGKKTVPEYCQFFPKKFFFQIHSKGLSARDIAEIELGTTNKR